MTLNEYRPEQYIGLSYKAASCRAQEVCRIASESGQTVRAAEHLTALVAIMERHAGVN